MRLGFRFYREFGETDLHEVFPTASYHMLARTSERLQSGLPYAKLRAGGKDLVDAFVAADTVRRFTLDQGTEVEDGLGTILLPTPLRPEEREHPVHDWPEETAG